MTPQTMLIMFFCIIVLVPLSVMLYSLLESLKSAKNIETLTISDGERDRMSLKAVERAKKR